MKRRIFNAIAVLSAVLCVGTVGLFIRSFLVTDYLSLTRLSDGYRRHAVSTGRGGISFLIFHAASVSVRDPYAYPIFFYIRRPVERYAGEISGDGRLFGIATATVEDAFPGAHIVLVPLLLPALLFAIPPALWLRSRRHIFAQRDAAARLCARCGYDLRATPERCPECGTVPEKKQAEARAL